MGRVRRACWSRLRDWRRLSVDLRKGARHLKYSSHLWCYLEFRRGAFSEILCFDTHDAHTSDSRLAKESVHIRVGTFVSGRTK